MVRVSATYACTDRVYSEGQSNFLGTDLYGDSSTMITADRTQVYFR
jgi:hypothetical protein